MSGLITDNEIVALRGEISKLSEKTAREKWKLCQRVFSLWKAAEKDKDKALEDRKSALMRSDEYKKAHEEYRRAKFALEAAEKEVLTDDDINKEWEQADGMRLMRNEEGKIFKGMFDQAALACKKDPMQVAFSLFVENENDKTHNRFGEYFRYDLEVEGAARFNRGKNRKNPTEYEQEIADQEKEK